MSSVRKIQCRQWSIGTTVEFLRDRASKESLWAGQAQHCYCRHVSYQLPAYCAAQFVTSSLFWLPSICDIITLLASINLWHHHSSVSQNSLWHHHSSGFHLAFSAIFSYDQSFVPFAIDVTICHISHVRVTSVSTYMYNGYWSAIPWYSLFLF